MASLGATWSSFLFLRRQRTASPEVPGPFCGDNERLGKGSIKDQITQDMTLVDSWGKETSLPRNHLSMDQENTFMFFTCNYTSMEGSGWMYPPSNSNHGSK
jgi:hypothetical protein